MLLGYALKVMQSQQAVTQKNKGVLPATSQVSVLDRIGPHANNLGGEARSNHKQHGGDPALIQEVHQEVDGGLAGVRQEEPPRGRVRISALERISEGSGDQIPFEGQVPQPTTTALEDYPRNRAICDSWIGPLGTIILNTNGSLKGNIGGHGSSFRDSNGTASLTYSEAESAVFIPYHEIEMKALHRVFTNTSSETDFNNEDRIRETPLAEEIFKKGSTLGSYKQGDSTFATMIQNYADLGDIVALEVILDRIRRDNRVMNEKVFIIVFKAYGKACLPDKAVNLFRRMGDEFQCVPSVRSFNSVLNVLIQGGLYDRALSFYSNGFGKGVRFSPNYLTFNLVIKAFCRKGLVDRAVETFREMSFKNCAPDVFTYSTLMDGLCKYGRIDEAVSLLDEMQVEGCSPNPVTFNVLINGLCKRGDMIRASKLVDNMYLKGCVPNEVTYNTLIHSLCLEGKLDKAVSLVERMVSDNYVPNNITYGTIINGLVKQGKAIEGAQLLIAMEERGYHPNEFIYSTLVSGLFKKGNSKDAMKLWKEMIEKGCKPNIVVYSALVDGLCGEGKLDEASEVLSEMVSNNCIPNAFTYSSLMKGFFNTGKCEKAILCWKEMEKKNCIPSEVCYSVLIDGLCKDGKIKEGLMVWKHMLGRGFKPDVVAYSSMIHGLCNVGLVDDGLRLFNEMLCQDPETQPDVVTYNILLNGLCQVDTVSRAIDFLHSMLDQGCDPDLYTCNIFLKSLREKLNPPQDGRDFLDGLVIQLSMRRRIVGASKIVEVMLQKHLSPKISTWERVIQDLCTHTKMKEDIAKCWSNLFGQLR
ncbi:hypothetical protein GIB67_021122 [Kingdonia uniflora]|uniref:Pentatricopeptide repeat-containing protein n=1 Tax=Kingdonia uniflora TaxID=39325 RepID=A0A7J7N7B6_9MAGN|nr:hypothetical protein GIB67_021122 [Kingdonia uniflora]